jgi:hypothetical protein
MIKKKITENIFVSIKAIEVKKNQSIFHYRKNSMLDLPFY